MNSNYESFIPYTFKLEKKSAKSQEIAVKLKEYYFGDKPVSRETLQPLFDVSNINVYVLHTLIIIRHVLGFLSFVVGMRLSPLRTLATIYRIVHSTIKGW